MLIIAIVQKRAAFESTVLISWINTHTVDQGIGSHYALIIVLAFSVTLIGLPPRSAFGMVSNTKTQSATTTDDQRPFTALMRSRDEVLAALRLHIDKLTVQARRHADNSYVARQNGELGDALKEARIAVALEPSSATTRCLLAEVFVDRREYELAAQVFAGAVDRHIVDSTLLALRGYLAIDTDQPSMAIDDFRMSLTPAHNDPKIEPAVRVALAYAEQAAMRARSVQPPDPTVGRGPAADGAPSRPVTSGVAEDDDGAAKATGMSEDSRRISAGAGGLPAPSAVRVQLKASQSLQYDTNPLLSLQQSLPVVGSISQPEAVLTFGTENALAAADTRLDVNEYDRSRFSSTDVHSTFQGTYDENIWKASISGNVDYDTTRTSELLTSGINVAGVRHLGLGLAPELALSLTQRDQLLLDENISSATYSNTNVYTDYNLFGGTATFQHAFDELNSGIIAMQASRYTTEKPADYRLDQISPALGWKATISQTLSASAQIGYQRTFGSILSTDLPGASGFHQQDYVFSGELSWKNLNYTADLTSGRQLSPIGTGSEAQTTFINFAGTATILERLQETFDGRYQQSAYTRSIPGDQRQYFDISPGLIYHATRYWDVSLKYHWRDQAIIAATGNAISNSVVLSLSYDDVPRIIDW